MVAMSKLFFILLFLSQLILFARPNSCDTIRGNSWFMDANQTLFLGQWGTNTVNPIAYGTYKNVITHGEGTHKNITLTFDDAPDEVNTPKLLDILKANDVKASFFMIGENMRGSNIALVKRAYDEGHLVLSHSFSHPRMTDLNATGMSDQLERTSRRIEEITGKYPLLFRPPYGAINPLVVDVINEHTMTTILWSMDSLDWGIDDPKPIVQIVSTKIQSGDIIMMHCNSSSVGALTQIIKNLKEQGYTFMSLDEMLKLKAYRNTDVMRNDAQEVVVDNNTNLMWQDSRDVQTVNRNWQGAKEYCENLVFAGYRDWRLPIMDDLFSIRDEKRKSIAINAGFKNVTPNHYWSSSNVYDTGYAWSMNFENGDDSLQLKNSNFYVRCVRDNPISNR
jgi:peptidoglycan/xylan/chitin deacetylase (PgdA/CDA1 family)